MPQFKDFASGAATFSGAHAILESTPDGVGLFDLTNKLVYANSKFCALWEVSFSALMQMTAEELLAHKRAMLSDPMKDAWLLAAGDHEVSNQQTNYIRLKNGRWYERLVFKHEVQGVRQGYVVQWRDVTQRHNALTLVQTERDLLHSLMDSVPHQIYFKDTQSRFTKVNKALAARYGLTDTSAVIGKSDADFYSAEHAAQTRREELEIMATRTPQLNFLHHEVWSDGGEAWNVSTKMPLIDPEGNVIGVYGIAHDVTEHKQSEAVFWRQANFDALTNLPNRRLMKDRWEQAAHLQKRNGGWLALMLIDLDHFKKINDTYGHAAGDELLVQAAQRMSACIRASDTLARLGGDEFALILSDQTTNEVAVSVVEKIRTALSTPFKLAAGEVQISGSVGAAVYPTDADNLDALLARADAAMYKIKSNGGNGYAFFGRC